MECKGGNRTVDWLSLIITKEPLINSGQVSLTIDNLMPGRLLRVIAGLLPVIGNAGIEKLGFRNAIHELIKGFQMHL